LLGYIFASYITFGVAVQIYTIGWEYREMKNEKIVKYDHIGDVLYRKNNRARNIAIRISRNGEVKVTVPRLCAFHTAESFVLKKQHWIKKKIISLERNNKQKLVWEDGSLISMNEGRIYIEKGSAQIIEVKRSNSDFQLFLSAGFQKDKEEDQLSLLEAIGAIGLVVAKAQLPVILESIAEKYGFRYTKVGVRRMKSRWGSCSPKNNISLNSALIFLTYDLIEYVLLHELVHTVHKNHGKGFWDMLIKLMPDAVVRRKKLNTCDMII
jgi:predicted metal-dependent hydrolase